MNQIPSSLDTTPPDVPSLDSIIDKTLRNAEERHRKEVQAKVEREFFKEHEVEIRSARLLSRIVRLIESAAGYGNTSVGFEESGIDVSADVGRAVARSLKESLKDFNPDILFIVPDQGIVGEASRAFQESSRSEYARAYYERACFHGWRVHLNWSHHIERRLRG